MTPVAVLARKEAGELVLSPRGIAWLLAMAALASPLIFVELGSYDENSGH